MATLRREGMVGVSDKTAFSGVKRVNVNVSGSKLVMKVRDEVHDFRKYVKTEDLVQAAAIKKRIVVVGQFPKAGTEVPAGTPVNLTLMYKDQIALGKMTGIAEEIQKKYADGTVALVTRDIASNTAVEKVLASGKKYEDLTAEEKKAVKDYTVTKEILQEDVTEEMTGKVYKDLQFILNF